MFDFEGYEPDVKTLLGQNSWIYFKNWLLAHDGSPTMQTFKSPRNDIPSLVFLCTPPANKRYEESLVASNSDSSAAITWDRII